MSSNHFDRISKRIDALQRLDLESPQGITLSQWCSDRITWAYKWKHITKEQMSQLCDRMIEIFEGEK